MEKKKTIKTDSEQKTNIPVSTRGRVFEGYVTKKFPKRIVVELERNVFVQKYERFFKKKTRLHARIFDDEVSIGDYVQIMECRPLSKIIHFVLVKIIRKHEGVKK